MPKDNFKKRGGFPPIIKFTKEKKQEKEFSEKISKITKDIKTDNLLDISGIL